MADKNIYEALLSASSYRSFRTKCTDIAQLTDELIKQKYCLDSDMKPNEVRNICNEWLDTITEQSFFDKKHTFAFQELKNNADMLAKAGCVEEANTKYSEAIREAEKISDRAAALKVISTARMAMAWMFYGLKECDKAVEECKKVIRIAEVDLE